MSSVSAPNVFLGLNNTPLPSTHVTRKVFEQTLEYPRFTSWNKERLLAAFDNVQKDFGALKKDGKSKVRRTGEPLYLHSVGVGYMLMDEFGESDPDLIFEALHHDYGEDIDWEKVVLPKPPRHLFPFLSKAPLIAPVLTHPLSAWERSRLRGTLLKRPGFNKSNTRVVSALTIDKDITLSRPHDNIYYDQIASLKPHLRNRAAKIRLADKVYNLRAAEPNLADPRQWKRLAKQTRDAIRFTLPISDLIEEKDRKKYTAKLTEAIVHSMMRLEKFQREVEARIQGGTDDPKNEQSPKEIYENLQSLLRENLAALQDQTEGVGSDIESLITSTRKQVANIWGVENTTSNPLLR